MAEPAKFPPRNSEPDLRDLGNSNSGHVCHSPQHASSPVYVSNLGASNTALDALSQDWQGKSMFMFPPFPLLSKVIQKLRTTQVFVWTTLSSFHTAGTYCHNRDMSQMASRTICMLGGSHAALPSSRIFEQVSRLAAAPRRPSANIVFDDRWLHFAHWAAGQGFDLLGPTAAQIDAFLYYLFDTQGLSPQSIKGYRSILASVLSRTAMAAAVQAKMMSNMITSVELQRPRMTPVIPQWNLDIIQEALSKPPYVPLWVASLKHLTLKTVFLLAMASARRCREL